MKKGQRGSEREQLYLYLSMPPGPGVMPPPSSSLPAPAASNLVRILLRRSQPANGNVEPAQPAETTLCLASMRSVCTPIPQDRSCRIPPGAPLPSCVTVGSFLGWWCCVHCRADAAQHSQELLGDVQDGHCQFALLDPSALRREDLKIRGAGSTRTELDGESKGVMSGSPCNPSRLIIQGRSMKYSRANC
jgi:hypothetical protein